jgi:hypothetical protein
MDLPDCEEQLTEGVAEGIAHDLPAAAQDSAAFTSASGDIDHLERMENLT